MSSTHFETVIVGGGAMGTAAAWQLAKRGKKVLLLEQYSMGHELGSSTGYSRIIRRAYFEHPDYVPLVDRAYELWRELERESGDALLTITGIVEMGMPNGSLVAGSLLSCKQHNIPHERLNSAEIRSRFPQFTIPDEMEGIWQKDAGILAVERCVLAQYLMAKKSGTTVLENTPALKLSPRRGGGLSVETARGAFTADTAIVSAGAWAGRLLAELKIPLKVARQAQGFYVPKDTRSFELGTFPLWLMQMPNPSGGTDLNFYGFPIFGPRAIKIAHHGGGDIVQPDTVDRIFRTSDDQHLREFMRKHLPGGDGAFLLGKICLYTNTPDHDFIIDAHPSWPGVYLAAGFSGHGFKFAPAVGETLADFVTQGRTRHVIGRFDLKRLLKQ